MNLLYETVTLTATLLFLLQLTEFKRAERLENCSKIIFSDGEVDVSYVKAVEGNAVRQGGDAFGVASLTVLFCFSELSDNRDAT